MSKKGLLIILDGYGEGKPDKFNAVVNAKTPFLDSLKSNMSLLRTDGEAVGLVAGYNYSSKCYKVGSFLHTFLLTIAQDLCLLFCF